MLQCKATAAAAADLQSPFFCHAIQDRRLINIRFLCVHSVQATHERHGGSRPTEGSKLRQRETARFFAATAAKLAEWRDDIAACDQLFCRCVALPLL